ncbi:hypothetical protein CG747_34265 [Streptomyces sp. CB02959]|nr:hypothetical protein CG747_34265 [Streptomyces sp. CB02959]
MVGQGDRPDHGKSQSGAVAAALRSAPERLEEGRDPGSLPLRILHGIDLTVEAGELLAAAEALRDVGLGHRLHHHPDQLSGGEKQRVAIARALVGHPALLLADEPTGALDSVSGAAVVDLLRTLNGNGTTVVVTTHDRELTASFPRRIGIHDGRIDFDEQGPQPAGGAL